MKTITVNVSEPVYNSFKEYAKSRDRTTSELIREAMELYQAQRINRGGSLRNRSPSSVGDVKKPYLVREDLLGEMLDEMIDEDRD
jgi:hypothetical protein